MSSSNLVRVALIEESVYGVTPAVGDFSTVRFTSESLSGTPETTESQQIRTDRLSSGQIVTGLTLSGDINYELAKETVIDKFFESALASTFSTSVPVTVDLTLVTTGSTLTRASGDWNSDIAVGDVLTLAGFTSTVNNTQVMVVSINSATEIEIVGPDTLVDEVGSGTTYQLTDKMGIGITKKSFSMEKAFLDLSEKAINYRGLLVSSFNLSASYGEIVTGSFSFVGNDYEPVDAAADFMTDSRTITDPATTQSLNGTVDMPFLVSSQSGTLQEVASCIQSITIDYANNETAQNCIGRVAAKDYSLGTAVPSVTIEVYNSNDSFSAHFKKLTQEPFAIGFVVKNSGGFYGFYMPAVQVSFDDAQSQGRDQDITISMSGQAKVGANGESSLYVFKG